MAPIERKLIARRRKNLIAASLRAAELAADWRLEQSSRGQEPTTHFIGPIDMVAYGWSTSSDWVFTHGDYLC